MSYDLEYLKLLSKQYPSVDAVSTEIVNLSAIILLPKGTEHFLADIHGEDEAFDHVLRNASGVVKRKIDDVFMGTLSEAEKKSLATLVYYPREKLELEKAARSDQSLAAWHEVMMLQLVQLCRQAAYKYTRSKVRKAIPEGFQYIIEELLHENEDDPMKQGYYQGILDSLLDIGRAEDFIVAIAELIRKLVVDHLHIIGDIYDRGKGAHLVMDTLRRQHTVDIQWGNHDVLWIGAACGSDVCMADAIRVSLRYGNLETLQEGYGLNLSPLVRLALDKYSGSYAPTFQVKSKEEVLEEKDLVLLSRMQKAIAIIQLKLEGQLALRRPELGLGHRRLLERVDLSRGAVEIEGAWYPLLDKVLPTLDPANPYELTAEERDVVEKLRTSFDHATDLQKHIRFLVDKGGMYKVFNGNLLYHGGIPMTEAGAFETFKLAGKALKGKALLDRFDDCVRSAYYAQDPEEKAQALDVVWYLWCGEKSPLFGKSKMATFERYFVEAEETHKEVKNPYYALREDEDVCVRILSEFGLNAETSHIINGHVPVKVVKGEMPIKAGGKLITIDGGLSKAYQKVTGIAGYTLIFNSQGMHLVSHEPFESKTRAVQEDLDMLPTSVFIEKHLTRMLVGDTDNGALLKKDIEALKALLQAYRDGRVRER
ncbi:fructose-1,6-bisphosphatase [Acidaminobacter hydrogenoformans]|uniref:Fructose-1,6-bisphosphatase class 3 n=1 Tax=Acidaminobacter hydrogenoformans DSM 2784 TaxID=1120920 RepID=A0A1G5RX64_9FIRM|nr:fructose-1,6-bisphosphatase [Acidaminobacter hydrogenoformans]SCZ78633.1 fructose-1,6-bisphosphatase-3 [Acidaminobacter hydrogenoformans DSM 2784]